MRTAKGVEGKFYVWSADEIREALGDDADAFMRIYGVSDEGNWEGHNILNLRLDPKRLAAQLEVDAEAFDARMAEARATLYELRSKRIWPGPRRQGPDFVERLDAGRVRGRLGRPLAGPTTSTQPKSNADFLQRTMRRDSGRLFRTWKAGR